MVSVSVSVNRNYGVAKPMFRLHTSLRPSVLIALSLLVCVECVFPCSTAAQAGSDSPEFRFDQKGHLMHLTGADGASPPVTITLSDAIARARKNDTQFLAASADARISHEDRVQARNAMLPSISATTQYLLTQGNGKTSTGRFVTNDGVHVYRAWGVLHQDLSPQTYMMTSYHRAAAAEAISRAKAEIANRGLTVTVTKLYYTFAVTQHRYATAQQSLEQGKHFFDIAQHAEQLGQAAHADVIKAEIQFRQQEQGFEESRLAMENARLDLAVLLFPTLNENFAIVDDLESRSSTIAKFSLSVGKSNTARSRRAFSIASLLLSN